MSTAASYTHLRDGSWGVRLVGTASPRQTVSVTKKDGGTKTETIDRVLWTGRDAKTGQTISLCTIAQSRRDRYTRNDDGDIVRCRHCGQKTAGGDDWCHACGRGDYE